MYTATAMQGPWTAQEGGDLACVAPSSSHRGAKGVQGVQGIQGIPTPGQGCLYNGSTDVSTTHAQQNFVLHIPDTDQYLWTGDLWQQSPDGLKGHEGQYWTLLDFDDGGRVGKVVHQDHFTMNVTTPAASFPTTPSTAPQVDAH